MKFPQPIGIVLLCLLPPLSGANDILSALYKTAEIPGVERHYFFQTADAVLQNAGEEFHPLFFDPEKEGEKPQLTEGHETNDCAVALSGERFLGDAIPFSTNRFSILLWVRPMSPLPCTNAPTANASLIMQNGDGTRSGWRLLVHDWKTPRIAFELASRKKRVQLRSSEPFPLEGWIQVAVVCDGQTIELFQNGISVCTALFPSAGIIGQPIGDLQFGGKSGPLPATRMEISEFCFFDGTFTRGFLVDGLFSHLHQKLPAIQFLYRDIQDAHLVAPRKLVSSKDNSVVTYERSNWMELFGDAEIPKFLGAMVPDFLLRYAQDGVRIPSGFLFDLRDDKKADHPLVRAQLDILQAESYLQEQNLAAAREVIRSARETGQLHPVLSSRLQMLLLETRMRAGETEKALALIAEMQKDSNSPSLEQLFDALSLSRSILREKNEWVRNVLYPLRTNVVTRIAPFFLADAQRRKLPSYLVKEIENAVQSCASPHAQPQAAEPGFTTPPPELPTPYFSFYVSPAGDDSADGTIDRPFRTPERARDAVRLQKQGGRLPHGGIRVYLRGGNYPIAHPFQLLDIDSGSFQAPVVYLAYPGETPVWEAGIPLKIRRSSGKDSIFQAPLPKLAAERPSPLLWDAGELLSYGPNQSALSISGKWTIQKPENQILLSLKRQPFFSEPMLAHLSAPLVIAEEAQNVIFSGITFRNGLRDAVTLKKCKNIQVRSCTIEQMGNNGIVAGESSNLRIYGNRIRSIGGSAMLLHGGNRVSLTSSYIQVENNLISRTGLLSAAPTHAAIRLSGCAIAIRHNDLIDIPGTVIQISGNDHLIERNRFEQITYHSDARSAIILSGDPSFRGNQIQQNLFRDVGSSDRHNSAIESLPGGCGLLVRENLFDRIRSEWQGAILISGGQHHIIDANVFFHSIHAIHIEPHVNWNHFLNKPEVASHLTQTINVFAYPYLTKYPKLANLREDANRHFIWRNIFVDDDLPIKRPGQTESVANRSIIHKDMNRVLSLLPRSWTEIESHAGRYPDPNRADAPVRNTAQEDRQ